MIRLSPTQLDSFLYHRRRVADGRGDWEDLIEDLTIRRETEAMRVGSAWHATLGRMGAHGLHYLPIGGGYGWNDKSLCPDPDINFRVSIDSLRIICPDEWEVPVRNEIETEAGPVMISGRLDGICDDEVGVEFKTTSRGINIERYLESYQWRCYLVLVPYIESIRYEVVQLQKKRGSKSPMIYSVVAHRAFTAPRYDELESDVRRELGDFASAVKMWADEGRLEIGSDGRIIRREED